MAGASGDWSASDTPWYQSASDWLLNVDGKIAGTVLGNMFPQAGGPAGALIKGARDVNTTSKTVYGNNAPGIRLPGSVFDKFIQVPDVPQWAVSLGGDTGAKTGGSMFDDSKKLAGKPASDHGGTDLPFWGKTAIIASVIIGTVLIVKGAFK